MSVLNKPLCQAKVWGGYRMIACSVTATRDGWCGTHHPDAVAKRKAASRARTQERMAALEAGNQRAYADRRKIDAHDALVAALRDTLDSLEYVNRAHPGISGYGVRTDRIRAARAALKFAGASA